MTSSIDILDSTDRNRIIAEMVEPAPPEISMNEWGYPVVEGEGHPVYPFSAKRYSPLKGWFLVQVYEEWDIPRWEPTHFTEDFNMAVEAYRSIVGINLHVQTLERDQWSAFNPKDTSNAGRGRTAPEAIVDNILRTEL